MSKPLFRFKRFTIHQDRCTLKVGTDSLMFGAWVNYNGAERILDIGTGTGVLAMIAAQRNAFAHIHALDIDPDSAQQATENAAAGPWPDRINVVASDVRAFRPEGPFDLILCNPPYYANQLKPKDARTVVAKHEHGLQLQELVVAVDRLLGPRGRFAVIIPIDREKHLTAATEKAGLWPVRRCIVSYVPHKPPRRVLFEFQRDRTNMIDGTLTVEATGPFDYSPQYKALIADLMPGF